MLFVWPGLKYPVNMPPLPLQAKSTQPLTSALSMPQPQAKQRAMATSALMEAMTAMATVAEIFMMGGVSLCGL
jgi:hypothetical protein